MRTLVRPRVAPPTLAQIGTAYPLDDRGSAAFPDGKWNSPDVRGALYAMHGIVCAYCGSVASDNRGDVEHYRPQAIYPWLTYVFVNYLIGCRKCNSSRKSDKFPLFPRARRLRYRASVMTDRERLMSALARERRLLLDPASDPIDQWVDLDHKDALCPVRESQGARSDGRTLQRVQGTIEFFGLNTVVELVQERSTHVHAAIIALRKWREGDLASAKDVRSLSNRYVAHGWAVRRVASVLAPDLVLPTAEEDLEWLVGAALEKLDATDRILARLTQEKDRPEVESRRMEACWTLATLWKDPPAASAAQVEHWINAKGKRGVIEPLLARL